ncbi:hypothetical protein [Streptomyces sp. NBC_01565]|uniref:hypothetical protein n=1 Tax=unclassified Streptomyces TaxID=2593676 RepID=UPI00225750EB|nr:hypothetical protein [Streptomyces sp. NBC_01565]MCX4541910.1 hypothetical protein [Streptomyces sp. NBC_01565]
MAVTLSLVVLLGLVLAVMLRTRHLGPGAAIVAVGFGFFLADTGASAAIHTFVATLTTSISGL